ncbi:hypothetical protein SIM22_03055 [Bacillus cereus group sp. BfR-BA-01363]|uniref:hypothetical protein n=1 Tax=Bacillus cereus group sp. BfR-BA-01363 TaxID=3094882 RepID=UPI0029C132F3|nr:hypothetical protein [Bacillus cereus group sp. BfR-BA-01363]MDX5853101.1 hypothetical protein [Bacillus cereus group sp. BfR-BA-01363]
MNIKNKNKMLSLFATGVVLTAGLPLTAHADTEKKEIAVQEIQGEKVVPMKKLLDEMKGQVQEGSDENGDYKVYIVGNKSIKIHEKSSCAYVDGELQPYKKEKVGGFTFPTYWEPMYTADDVLVPANFVVDVLPVKLNGDKIEFDVEKKVEPPKEEPKTEVKEEKKVNVPNLKEQEQNQKRQVVDKKVEPTGVQKRESNQTPQGNNESNSSQQHVVKPKEPIPPKKDDAKNKETQVKEENQVQPPQNNQNGNGTENKNVDEGKPNTVDGKIYTAPEVKQLAYSLGFFDGGKGLRFNPHGKEADKMFDVANLYATGDGQWDVTLFIYNDDSAINDSLHKLLNNLLPNKGDDLYSILDSSKLTSQEMVMDGRVIKIDKKQSLAIYFGPKQR